MLFIAPLEIPGLLRRIIHTQHVLALPNTPLALPAKVVRDWLAVPLPLTAGAIAVACSFAARRMRWHQGPGYAAVLLGFYYGAQSCPMRSTEAYPTSSVLP